MKKGKTTIALILSAIVMILRYNNVFECCLSKLSYAGVKHEDFLLLRITICGRSKIIINSSQRSLYYEALYF